jgi:hypothetical protein
MRLSPSSPSSPSRKAPQNKHNWFPDAPPKIEATTLPINDSLYLSHPFMPKLDGSSCVVSEKTVRRHSKTSTGSKSTNPPTDNEEVEDEQYCQDEDFDWGFHCSLEDKSSIPLPCLSLHASSPPARRYSADDVDYLKQAMFILEREDENNSVEQIQSQEHYHHQQQQQTKIDTSLRRNFKSPVNSSSHSPIRTLIQQTPPSPPVIISTYFKDALHKPPKSDGGDCDGGDCDGGDCDGGDCDGGDCDGGCSGSCGGGDGRKKNELERAKETLLDDDDDLCFKLEL